MRAAPINRTGRIRPHRSGVAPLREKVFHSLAAQRKLGASGRVTIFPTQVVNGQCERPGTRRVFQKHELSMSGGTAGARG
ncbi:MAG: hypothetical protein WA005_00285, partial [Candidatus Binataceae bacterium]